jgi:hypothetical protein
MDYVNDEGATIGVMWLVLAAAVLFRIFRELEDEVARGRHRNWSYIPNSGDGWTAKYKYPLQPYRRRWYHFGIYPKHEERFAYSTTLFVAATDAEHFYQFIQTVALIVIGWHAIGWLVVGLVIGNIIKEIVIE